jgi:hypothetical protein
MVDYQAFVRIVTQVLNHLAEEEAGVPQVFVSGEFDSNQTDFERKCNQLEIGVLAGSELVGKACLPLLRLIIDDGVENLWDKIVEAGITLETPVHEVATKLATFEEQYGKVHEIETGQLHDKLMGVRNGEAVMIPVLRNIDEMDLYTLKRIRAEFERIEEEFAVDQAEAVAVETAPWR